MTEDAHLRREDLDGAMRALLERARPGATFVLTSHVHPDGDGIGSEIALAELLDRCGARVAVVNADPPPPSLETLEGVARLEVYDPAAHDRTIRDATVIVMLDNSDPARLGVMEPAVRASTAHRVCIDHHPHPSPFWDRLIVDQSACCTGALIHRLWQLSGHEPDRMVASALYAALVSDTGRFRFANTGPDAFRLAAELVGAGASPAELYTRLEEQASEGFVRLLGETLAALELRGDGAIVVLRVTAEALARHAIGNEDTAEIINAALMLGTSRVAALFRELSASRTKVSLRSKGDVPVNELARSFGGGGHRNAAGIVLDEPLEQAVERVCGALERLVQERG
ncbi:MAG: bifunctional oligoribonuclease/PAP phosphatase NrnA [Acidobacteria bacterium]|nr:MAG: bifunctional oligoribonuclease/PAP phosphatase NrnA [Acidobacteriota bacterium]